MALDEPKGWVALFVGLILLALGLIPTLASLGVIGFNLPAFMLNVLGAIITWVIAAGGLYLAISGIMEDDSIRIITLLLALIVIIIGVIPILFSFGVLSFTIPFLTPLVSYIILVVEGIFLMIAAFQMN